jgi:hypothetical protein
MARHTVKKVSNFPFEPGCHQPFLYDSKKVKDQTFSEQRKKVTAMSVDTDKGIDDLPPDADTIRDTTPTLFSWRKKSFLFYISWIVHPLVEFVN